jgi:hypothetical protein
MVEGAKVSVAAGIELEVEVEVSPELPELPELPESESVSPSHWLEVRVPMIPSLHLLGPVAHPSRRLTISEA